MLIRCLLVFRIREWIGTLPHLRRGWRELWTDLLLKLNRHIFQPLLVTCEMVSKCFFCLSFFFIFLGGFVARMVLNTIAFVSICYCFVNWYLVCAKNCLFVCCNSLLFLLVNEWNLFSCDIYSVCSQHSYICFHLLLSCELICGLCKRLCLL